MNQHIRTLLAATLLLLIFLSLPLWLPETMASSTLNTAGMASLNGLPPILLWSNNWQPDAEGIQRNSPRMLSWMPSNGEAMWILETGFAYGAVLDAQQQRIYFVEEPVHDPYTPASPLVLGVADLSSGELLSRSELRGPFFANSSSGAPSPVLVLDNTLYFTNHHILNNLAAYDLITGTLSEERYDLCEKGYPTHYEYAAGPRAIATLCIDFSTSEMNASLTLLSLADGSQHSLDLSEFGSKEQHTVVNGLVIAGNRAYAVNSDTYTIAEINLESMQIVRQANYAQAASAQGSIWQLALAWLLEQAASPAQAKVMFAVTALSPEGDLLAVGGSMLHGNRRELYLVDLDTLQTVQRVRAGGMASQLAFASKTELVAVYQGQGRDEWFRAALIDLANSSETNLAIPVFGYLRELLVLPGK